MAVALALGACSRQQQTYVIDPATGQTVAVMAQQPYASPRYAQTSYAAQGDQRPSPQADANRGLLSSASRSASYARQPAYAQPYQQLAAQPSDGERGLFNARPGATPAYPAAPRYPAPTYAAAPLQKPYVLQYSPPRQAVPPRYAAPQPDYAAAPASYSPAYTLDSGDRLRIVVFGQEGISSAYIVDAGGNVTLPLIGMVPARGLTTQQLAHTITERLKQGYVREPHVSVEVEVNRPFFILGEVTTPGQYPYVADMTVEKAIAVAGGFAPRAYKRTVELTRNAGGQQYKGNVPLNYPVRPGDTLLVKERWF